jgi:hypothetical protein
MCAVPPATISTLSLHTAPLSRSCLRARSYDLARTARLATFNAFMGVLGHHYYLALDGVSATDLAADCAGAFGMMWKLLLP